MLGDFFRGLGSGLKRDPIIWVLLLLNLYFGAAAYSVWFEMSPDRVRGIRSEMLRDLSDLWPDLSSSTLSRRDLVDAAGDGLWKARQTFARLQTADSAAATPTTETRARDGKRA